MNKKIMLGTIGILALSFLANSAYAQTLPKMPQINEDQIITCVKDVSDTNNRNSLICHIFDINDLDWYQEIQTENYGMIGDLNDSFELGLID